MNYKILDYDLDRYVKVLALLRLVICHFASLKCNTLRVGLSGCWSLPTLYSIICFWLKAHQSALSLCHYKEKCSHAQHRSYCTIISLSVQQAQKWKW